MKKKILTAIPLIAIISLILVLLVSIGNSGCCFTNLESFNEQPLKTPEKDEINSSDSFPQNITIEEWEENEAELESLENPILLEEVAEITQFQVGPSVTDGKVEVSCSIYLQNGFPPNILMYIGSLFFLCRSETSEGKYWGEESLDYFETAVWDIVTFRGEYPGKTYTYSTSFKFGAIENNVDFKLLAFGGIGSPLILESSIITKNVTDDDPDPPTIVLNEGQPPYQSFFEDGHYDFPFDVEATDLGSGINQIKYEIGPYSYTRYYDQGFPSTVALSKTVELVPSMYLLEIWAVDADNDRLNDQAGAYINKTIDLLAPSSNLKIGGPDWYDVNLNIHFLGGASSFYFSPDDPSIGLLKGSGVQATYYKIDNEESYHVYDGSNISPQLLGLSHDYHTISFYSEDNVGNIEFVHSFNFFFDRLLPFADIYFNTPYYNIDFTTYITSQTLIDFSYGEIPDFINSGVASFNYLIDNDEFEYIGPFFLSGYSEGSHSLSYSVLDKVGNGAFYYLNIFIDDIPPLTETIFGNPHYSEGQEFIYINAYTPIMFTTSDFGVGTKATYYKIDDDSLYNLYTGPFTLEAYSDGFHTIEFYSEDYLGNQEAVKILSVILDTVPPVTQIALNGPNYEDEIGNCYLTSSSKLSLISADFGGSGTATLYYKIDGGAFIEYSTAFTLDGYLDGTHTIEYYSVDNVNNQEEPFNSKTVNLDNTPPNTVISIDFYYDDGMGSIYVTIYSQFSLNAADFGSKVATIYYQIDEGGFNEFLEPFTLQEFAEGYHIINFYCIDHLNNKESLKSIGVTIVSLEVNTFISDGDLNLLSYFDVIFAKNKQDGVAGFKLVATNPGQMFYHIEIKNTWLIAINCLTVDVNLPKDFETQGTMPIHIYLDDLEITQECFISETQILVYNISSGSKVEIEIHVDYALKGKFYETIDNFVLLHYDFNVKVQSSATNPSSPSETLIDINYGYVELLAHQKKTTALAGYIKDTNGIPIAGVTVQIRNSDFTIVETSTDEIGFYWFIQVEEGQFEIRLLLNNLPITPWQSITIRNNLLNLLNFLII